MSQEKEDFASLLSEYGGVERMLLSVGDRVKARIIHISESTVFCELSRSQEGFLPRQGLVDAEGRLTVKVGDTLEAFVVRTDEGIELSRRVGRDQVDLGLLEEAARSGVPVQGTVSGVNKGGIEVQIGGARGFCPMGQVDIEFVSEPAALIGKSLDFAVREVREGGRNILLSRRVLLERERRDKAALTLASLTEGQEVSGTVKRLAPFGAFVDIGGVDGLIAISELSHARVADPSEIVRVGEVVNVKVLRIEEDPKRPGQKRIALSLKASAPDPFTTFASGHQDGDSVSGKVVKLEPYGAFVELAPGLSGLAHVSEIAAKRIVHPRDVLELGQPVSAHILSIDVERRRISLSLREAPAAAPDAPVAGLAVGALAEGTVERVERYGVFLKLDRGATALMPASESGTPRGADLTRALPVGTKVAVKIIEVDERGRLKVSKKARDEHEERADMQAYMAKGSGSEGFGTTFGDLLKKR